MSKKTIIKGAAILTAANLIVKIMGFYYRTCMVKIIGAEGMGLYQLILPIYMLTWSITSSGLTTTISKLTAEENAKGESGNTKRILNISLCISAVISILLSLIIYEFSKEISTFLIHDERTNDPLKILSFTIPFMALGSCVRGHFMGLQKHAMPAISQIIEQIIRIAAIFILFPHFFDGDIETACVLAMWGIFLGETVSFIFIIFVYKSFSKKFYIKKPVFSKTECGYIVLSMAVPLTFARVIGSLLGTIENIMIPHRLALYPKNENALEVFGNISGMAMPLIMLPSAFLMAVSMTVLPALSETEALGNKKSTAILIEKSLCYTSIIGFGVAMVFAKFPVEISTLVYDNSSISSLLKSLCILPPFLYLSFSLMGILNGLGCYKFILIQNLISSAINIFTIYFFVPVYGINAFIVGLFISFVVIDILGLYKISFKCKLRFSFYKNIFSPSVCAIGTYIICNFLPENIFFVQFILNITFMAFLYTFLLLLCEVITIKELLGFLPKKFHLKK